MSDRAEDSEDYVKPNECPHCLYACECATNAGGGKQRPASGDFSVCVNCGEFARFDDKLDLVICGEDELQELQKDQLSLLLRAKHMIKRRGFLKKGPSANTR